MEVLISIALTTLAISFYMTYASQTNVSIVQLKNYLRAVNLMEQSYKDILISKRERWNLNSRYQAYFDINGLNVAPPTDRLRRLRDIAFFYSLTISPHEYTQAPGLTELSCLIEWSEDGKPRKIEYRVIK